MARQPRRRGGRVNTVPAPVPAPAPAPVAGGTDPTATLPANLRGPVTQRILDGLVRGEPSAFTIGAVVAMGVDPIKATDCYNYVKAHGYTPTIQQDVTGAVGGVFSGAAGAIIKALVPVLKVAAGGAGLLVAGLALVYVAGKNVTGTAAPVSRAVRTVASPVRAARAPERAVAARRKGEARRELANARVVTESTRRGGTRVRTTSRRSGREALGAEARQREAERRSNDQGPGFEGVANRDKRRKLKAVS